MLEVSWNVLKGFAVERGLSIQYVDDGSNYYLRAFDGLFTLGLTLSQHDPEEESLVDFETNFKANGNKKLDPPKDSDGSPLQRGKITTSGWKAQFHAMRISTATTNGIRNKKKDGSDLGFCTYKMYAVGGAETFTPILAIRTVITWEPNHDMEIVGGTLFQAIPATTNIWMYVTAAAHIPAAYGGSIAFLEGGMNLADVGTGGTVDFDGKSPKWIAYDSVNHSGRFEIELQHDVGVQHSFTLSFKFYRS